MSQGVHKYEMVQSRKIRPLEEVSNVGHDRRSMKEKPTEDRAKSSKNTPWHGNKTSALKLSPTGETDGKKAKGTPWPKSKNTIKHSPLPEIKTLDLTGTPLQEMHAAHLRLSETLKHVDHMVETAHRLRLSNQLSDEETRNFTSAMSDMTEVLKTWQNVFKTAEGRPQSRRNREALMLTDVTPPSDTSFLCLDNSISSSPLVPCSLQSSLFCLTPIDRSNLPKRDFAEIVDFKARLEIENTDSTSELISACASGKEIQSLHLVSPPHSAPQISDLGPPKNLSQATDVVSPLPETPRIISPPRSVRLKGPTLGSGGSSVGTPPHLREHLKDLPSTPPSAELQTPAIPKELVLRYPRSFGKRNLESPSTPIPETPGFGNSPPKTCIPIGLAKTGCYVDSSLVSDLSTPCSTARKYFETPYVTPGSVLPPTTPVSLSRELTPLVDDITASAIKRMGVKGLEDELWRKLRAWNIDSCLTGRRYVKSRLSFGGSKNGVSCDLESIKENSDHVQALDSVSEVVDSLK